MAFTRTIILIRNDARCGGTKYPVYFQEILFKPLLRWLSDALFAAGGRSFCVVREDACLDDLILPCFSTLLSDLLVLDASSENILGDVSSYLYEKEGEVLFITAPVLLTGHAVDSFSIAHMASGNLLTELQADDNHPSGTYGFSLADSRRVLSYLDERFDFGSACRKMRGDGLVLGSYAVSDGSGGVARVRNPSELMLVRRAMQTSVLESHMLRGVSVLDPAGTLISSEAVIGRDTTLLPGVIIQGNTVIGEDCEIGPYTLLSDCTVGDRSTINASQVFDSAIGSDVQVGPFAYVRPNCGVGDRAKIGDFVELKNSQIGAGTKVPHLSYVGDADLGESVNIGCGTIVVNYDGREKHRTTVGDGAFIGCNTNLVAPVEVHKDAYTAAGSTITKDVPAGALAVARARQENKEGWVAKNRPR